MPNPSANICTSSLGARTASIWVFSFLDSFIFCQSHPANTPSLLAFKKETGLQAQEPV